MLVVENALDDLRFADNPLVTGPPHIRFYAGQPLQLADDLPVGTLCLIDRQPRSFSQRDRGILKSLAGQVEELLRQHQIRRALAQTTRRYEALFNESATGIVRIDRSGSVLSINPFALTMLGYQQHEVVGNNVSMFTPASINAHHDSFLANFLAGSEPKVIGRGREVEALHKDGHLIPVHLAVNAIHNEQGDVAEFLGILTNLTDVYNATQQIHKEQSLLKVLHQGITDYQALMSVEQLWTFLMEALRELTDSDYVLIGEVLPTDTTNALKIHAITDLSWSDESRLLMERLRSGDMTLTNPKWLCKSYRVTFSVIITYVFDRFTELVERTVGCQR